MDAGYIHHKSPPSMCHCYLKVNPAPQCPSLKQIGGPLLVHHVFTCQSYSVSQLRLVTVYLVYIDDDSFTGVFRSHQKMCRIFLILGQMSVTF